MGVLRGGAPREPPGVSLPHDGTERDPGDRARIRGADRPGRAAQAPPRHAVRERRREPLAELRQHEPSPASIEALRPELLLEARDAPGEGGLGAMEGIGSGLERRGRRDGQQVSHVAQVDHDGSFLDFMDS